MPISFLKSSCCNRPSILDFGLSTQVTNPQTQGRQQPADAHPEVQKSQPQIQNHGSSIESPESVIEDGSQPANPGPVIQNPKSKMVYVLTPRRRAATLASLEKARAAPKDRVYRSTKKRRAANPGQSAEGQRRPPEHSGLHPEGVRNKTGISFRIRVIELAAARSVKDWGAGTRSSGSGGVAQSPNAHPAGEQFAVHHSPFTIHN